MVNYQNGKIYRIDGGGLTYYGSTCRELSKRLYGHKDNYKRVIAGKSKSIYTSIKLFETVDDLTDVKIYLEEKYPCNTKEELTGREGWWIRNNDCVNKCIPGRTDAVYYQDNKDKILEQTKKYYEKNKDKMLEKCKEYYKKNKDNQKEQRTKYRKENKDKINKQIKDWHLKNKEYKKACDAEVFNCECGFTYTRSNKARHQKSKRHLECV